MTTENEQNFYPFFKSCSIYILIFYGIDIVISGLWTFHYLQPLADKLAVILRIASDLLFCTGALHLLKRKDSGLTFLKLAAVVAILSVIVSKVYVFTLNASQGVLPNLPFLFLTLIQSLMWPIIVLWLINWVKTNFR